MPSAKQTRVAVVTGAASGIGLSTAQLLVAEGWRVAFLDANKAALEAAQVQLARAGSHFAALDVTDETATEATIAEVEAALGPITGVVNAAGIAADKHVFDTSAELFRRVLDINVVGTFLVGRAAARRMAARTVGNEEAGAIVNIASISGLRGSKGRSAYGASKGAVITLTQVMANDLARHNIRVNAIAPGPVDTPMVKALHGPDDRALFTRLVPMRRYAEPKEIASAIAFLLDPARASYITGEVLAVDGGFRGAGLIAD